MFGLRVPIISLVIGEGGSGGALAIGCANKNLIMENAVYYVASPEACAAILWKSRAAAAQVRWGLGGDSAAGTAVNSAWHCSAGRAAG
jgi:acetyl-CoA carboxylase carboxyl transferase subunit alpha